MDFLLTEEQIHLREWASIFAREKLAPFAGIWDEEAFFPVDVFREAAALGMAGLTVAEDLGGSQLSRLEAAIIFEQLATGCISSSAYLSIHNMVTSLVDQYAAPTLRTLWGPRLAAMDVLGSYCLTEPESGSDAAALKTRAVLDEDFYVVNGTKAFISGAGVSDVYLCMVRTGDETHHGISCLLIEKDTPGLSFGPPEKKMGWKNQPTAMVYFENCRVPAHHLVGELGAGFKIALSALNGGRVNIAACALGGALRCLQLTREYMLTRQQFQQPLTQFQALRFNYANMLTRFQAARLMVYKAASSLDQKSPEKVMNCSMAKCFATDVAFEISNNAMQLHGGYGYLHDYEIERMFRDLRVHQILEGTNEIMQEIIARHAFADGFLLE